MLRSFFDVGISILYGCQIHNKSNGHNRLWSQCSWGNGWLLGEISGLSKCFVKVLVEYYRATYTEKVSYILLKTIYISDNVYLKFSHKGTFSYFRKSICTTMA